MCVPDGFHVTVVGFLILTCVEGLTSTNQKTNSEHGSSTINDGDSINSDWKLSTDLDKTFNTFKRKDHIGKKHKQSGKKTEKLQKDERRHITGLSKGDVQQQISRGQSLTLGNTKRQYIFGAPSLIPAGAISHRFVAFSNPGLHTGKASFVFATGMYHKIEMSFSSWKSCMDQTLSFLSPTLTKYIY